LHHPIRAEYRLTYDPDSPKAMMYGFVNVLLAAALISVGENEQTALAALQEIDPSTIEFHDAYLQWRDKRISAEQLSHVRTDSAISFGSCSFREPIDELASLFRTTQPARM
jgi:hypothetical protein